ncbi:MAG: hypothetical protein ACOYLQ_06215 [Hyphomicrobiaceae bacterium]|jgi:hypothetical protein
MTLDTLTTAARAAGYAMAGEPLDGLPSEAPAPTPLALPRPATSELKPLDANWWRDWFSPRQAPRVPA